MEDKGIIRVQGLCKRFGEIQAVADYHPDFGPLIRMGNMSNLGNDLPISFQFRIDKVEVITYTPNIYA